MPNGVFEYRDFVAIHDHMPGSDDELRVTGTVVFRTGGYSAQLRPLEGPGGINPKMLTLVLHIDPPGPDDMTTDALDPVPVQYTLSNPTIEYTHVDFRVEGTDDEPPPTLEVEHPQ
jgi:hypothetical protein